MTLRWGCCVACLPGARHGWQHAVATEAAGATGSAAHARPEEARLQVLAAAPEAWRARSMAAAVCWESLAVGALGSDGTASTGQALPIRAVARVFRHGAVGVWSSVSIRCRAARRKSRAQ